MESQYISNGTATMRIPKRVILLPLLALLLLTVTGRST